MRFLDVRTDFAFKKVFGSEESKDVLISFLNALIPFPDGVVIDDLTIVDPYQIPLIKGMKDTFVDVKARLSNGQRVIIEMQVLHVEGFEQRILYNAAKTYSNQLASAMSFSSLEPVIALTVTDFILFPTIPDVLTCFQLLEKQHLVKYSGDVELIFAELPKFTKTEAELETITDKWLFFVKNAGDLTMVPNNFSQDQAFQKAFSIANEAGLTPEELEAQHKRHDFIMLQRGWLEKATKDGLAQGMKEGIQKGIEQGKKEAEERLIKQLMQTANVSREEAKHMLGIL